MTRKTVRVTVGPDTVSEARVDLADGEYLFVDRTAHPDDDTIEVQLVVGSKENDDAWEARNQ